MNTLTSALPVPGNPNEEFDIAIVNGRLSDNKYSPKFAGLYMYMGGLGPDAQFKNITTRKYLPRS